MSAEFIALLLAVAASSAAQNAFTSKSEGDTCRIKSDGRLGICLRLDKCPVAHQAVIARKLSPYGRCGFVNDKEVVCCPRNVEKAVKACSSYRSAVRPRLSKHIWNGDDAELAEFPHMAALGYRLRGNSDNPIQWRCGGSLITDTYILTAAHCFKHPEFLDPIVVRLGDRDLKSEDDDKYAVTHSVAAVIRHPRYTSRFTYNDIGLVRLQQTVAFNKYVYPACLHTSHLVAHTSVLITGWGVTDNDNQIDSPNDRILQKGNVNIVDLTSCNTSYFSNTPPYMRRDGPLPRGVIKSIVCGINSDTLVDACDGDSGGPMQYVQGDVYYVVGVTAYGPKCPSGTIPTFYTRVSRFIDWISYHVWP